MKIIFAFVFILIVLCSSVVAQDYTAEYWLHKGDGFYKNSSYDLALRCYDKAIEINPQYADAWHDKGDILKELGRTTEADAAFAKATELGYEDSTQVEIKPDKIAGESSVIDNSTVLLFDASDSMSGNKMNNAKIAIKEFISGLDPSTNEVALIVFYDCGSIKVEQPFTTDQSAISSKVDKIQPSRNTPISASIDLAQNYIAKNANGTKKKIILFTDGEETCPYTATYKGPEDIEISIIGFDIHKGSAQEIKLQDIAKKVGGNYLNADDASTPEALVSSLKQAYSGLIIKYNLDYAVIWVSKGDALYNQDKYDEAIKAYNEAIRIDPNLADAWLNKGIALDELGKYDEAIKANEEAVKLDPDNASAAWNNKGNALDGLGEYDAAIRAYDEAIRIDPNVALFWSNKGNALNNQDKYDAAIKAFDEAIRIAPNDVHAASAWNGKGNALNKQGKYDEAVKAFDEAIRIDPNLAAT